MGKTYKIYDVLKCKNDDIPLNDLDAWLQYPDHNWVYNRLELAKFQGLKCAPMPITPLSYPVIIKPIINLYGMGHKIIKVNNYDEFREKNISNKSITVLNSCLFNSTSKDFSNYSNNILLLLEQA